MPESLALCLDIGGTKLDYRFLDISSGQCATVLEGRLLCSEFLAFTDALHWLLGQVMLPVDRVCIAAAGPVFKGVISFTNLDWQIDKLKIQQKFALKSLILVNDLAAMMWSLQSLTGKEQIVVKDGDVTGQTKIIVAPGTGLGVGIGVETGHGLVCLPSEGGHVSFSPRNKLELELLEFMAMDGGHVGAETVCSGLGLGALFRFFTVDSPCNEKLDYHGLGPWLKEQVDGKGEWSAIALQVYGLFFDLLAEVCGNLAVTCLPDGGIYLTGGLMAKLAPFMDRKRFITRFLDRSVQKNVLESMKISQIVHVNPALVGCQVLLEKNVT